MKNIMSKLMMSVLSVALVFAAFPVTSAYAADEDPPVIDNVKLEKAWERLTAAYEKLGKAYEDTDAHIAKFQGMIDKAASNGKDVADLQAALDSYETALTSTRPQYEDLGQTIRTHSGFNANGDVTDATKALETLKQGREQVSAIKDGMGGTFKALQEAVKAFREANKIQREASGSNS